jgi:hypothetical protein
MIARMALSATASSRSRIARATWSIMETVLSVTGLVLVLVLFLGIFI